MFKKKEKKQEEKNNSTKSFIKEIVIIIVLAFTFRSLVAEPFHIPSGSMKPGLLVHDYIIVSKFSYGYSRYSLPFGLKLFSGRIFETNPNRGDVAVFRLPSNTSINYIKRIVGLPGDKIQIKNGQLFINKIAIEKTEDGYFKDYINYSEINIAKFTEILPNGQKITTLDMGDTNYDNSAEYIVPENHYFVMGDNRDNSQDSRFQTKVGFIPHENLIGEAKMIFFSAKYPFLQFWKWPLHIRFNRIFKLIK